MTNAALATELKEHRGEFKELKVQQESFNKEIEARVVETEKEDIRTAGKLDVTNQKLDAILDRLNKKTIGWQIWLPFSVTAMMAAIGLLLQVAAP